MKKCTVAIIIVPALAFFLAFSALAEDVQDYIPVQGKLTDAAGNPLEGGFIMTFRLYDVLSGGSALCIDQNLVTVTKGLFNSEIWGTCAGKISGQQLYLGIEVENTGEMTPRQPIFAVPYAWSLRPKTGADGIEAVLLRRQTGVCSSSSCYATILYDTTNYYCPSATHITGCTQHWNLTSNNVLAVDSGIL